VGVPEDAAEDVVVGAAAGAVLGVVAVAADVADVGGESAGNYTTVEPWVPEWD
jgi:hypothetical protein